jgi:hypothetical protein
MAAAELLRHLLERFRFNQDALPLGAPSRRAESHDRGSQLACVCVRLVNPHTTMCED